MKGVIITGDDFGLAEPVNEAIVEAHRNGILTTASLMVGAEAAADAVERARRVPSLRVGLHLVIVEGRPVLQPWVIPDLIDATGLFPSHFARSGFKFFFRPGVRKQLAAEIRAQFEAFHRTGLELDHVSSHNHMHIHPTVLRLMVRIGKEYGLRAVRLPNEAPVRTWRASRKSLAAKLLAWAFFSPWVRLMKRHLRQRQICSNDFIFGISDSGAMTVELLQALIRNLPEGVTEIYFHPATRRCAAIDRTMPEYRHEEEFKALTSASVRDTLDTAGVKRIAFCDLWS